MAGIRTSTHLSVAGIRGRIAMLAMCAAWLSGASAIASVISTTDPAAIAAFRSGRTVLGFDELVVPPGPCYVPLEPDQYASLGIRISAGADGLAQTHLCRLPDCGHFGPTLTPPNIIGGGTGPGSLLWRSTIRFDFPGTATAVGASADASGSRTTLTAYRTDGSVIASVSGDEGDFMGIEEPGIAYAVWMWNYDQSVAGFSLDNLTFSTPVAAIDVRPAVAGLEVEPNPFNPRTTIRYDLPEAGAVRLSVFDLAGRLVRTLVDENKAQGSFEAVWDGRDASGREISSGTYLARLEYAGTVQTARMTLVQ